MASKKTDSAFNFNQRLKLLTFSDRCQIYRILLCSVRTNQSIRLFLMIAGNSTDSKVDCLYRQILPYISTLLDKGCMSKRKQQPPLPKILVVPQLSKVFPVGCQLLPTVPTHVLSDDNDKSPVSTRLLSEWQDRFHMHDGNRRTEQHENAPLSPQFFVSLPKDRKALTKRGFLKWKNYLLFHISNSFDKLRFFDSVSLIRPSLFWDMKGRFHHVSMFCIIHHIMPLISCSPFDIGYKHLQGIVSTVPDILWFALFYRHSDCS